jgi:hypothetical protein
MQRSQPKPAAAAAAASTPANVRYTPAPPVESSRQQTGAAQADDALLAEPSPAAATYVPESGQNPAQPAASSGAAVEQNPFLTPQEAAPAGPTPVRQ